MMLVNPYDAWEPWPVDVRLTGGPEIVAVLDDDALAALPTSGRVGFAPPPVPRRKRKPKTK